MEPRSGRAGRLSSLLRSVQAGKRKIAAGGDAHLFLEAVAAHESPVTCLESLVSSPHGAEALQTSVRADLSAAFVKAHTLPFIRLLAAVAPELQVLAGGQILRQVVLWVVQPPTLWQSLLKLFLAGDLVQDEKEEHLLPFAWLVHEASLLAPGEFDDVAAVQAVVDSRRLLQAKDHEVRALAYKIEKIVRMRAGSTTAEGNGDSSFSPGGRHDNDFADFRKIGIYPTNDELLSTARPFYRRASDVFQLEPEQRAAAHLDNQFRLLREDMLAELREDMQTALGKKNKGAGAGGGRRRPPTVLRALMPVGLELGDEKKGKESSLAVACGDGLKELRQRPTRDARRKFLDDHRNYLKHQAVGVFVTDDDQIAAFAFVDRNIDWLCGGDSDDGYDVGNPVVCLRFVDSRALGKVLLLLRTSSSQVNNTRFVLVGTSTFSHEPVLNQLKEVMDLTLERSLVSPAEDDDNFQPVGTLKLLAAKYRSKAESMGGLHLGGYIIEQSQLDSLLNGLTRPLTVIQGPPGTGKSFIGAQIAKCFYRDSSLKILVISYTNHALDQFLEDLLKAGIPQDEMARLGSKSTAKTEAMLLSKQDNYMRHSAASSAMITALKAEQMELRGNIQQAFDHYQNSGYTFDDLMEHLEFSEDDRLFHDAFVVPTAENGWSQVGSRGKEVEPGYLYSNWLMGKGPGPFARDIPKPCWAVWRMDVAQRRARLATWTAQLAQERVESIEMLARQYDETQALLDRLFSQGKTETLRSKRIIACTTTAAAMYHKSIRAAQPDVVLVEEAGEILESHVLTALASPSVKQLILIGDHKQLRPRYNSYALTVEKGEGYDFNMSMFERLIRQGCPYTTLRRQHRMHRAISVLPRALTYPELLDGDGTAERDPIRGLRDRVIFVHHEHEETQLANAVDRYDDPEAKSTKQNRFEAEMCLRLVRYLAQQGYGTADMVVLTPYVGQLRLLMDTLSSDSDPILNDLDAADLVRAGLMTEAASKVDRGQLRISTIDNYQGEESDIVIGSLTRSNARGDIGFMAAPERLNVLITRARNCLILIGNTKTFLASSNPEGRATWEPFFAQLKQRGHLYDGFPAACERHPDTTAILKEPADFDRCCPDGGCAEPCGAKLKCGAHACQRRCHRIADHSRAECTERVPVTCDRGHRRSVPCTQQKSACRRCADEDKERERQIQRDLKLEEERLARQVAYAAKLQEVQDKIDHERKLAKYHAEEDDLKKALAQKTEDLRAARETADRIQQQKKAAKKQAEAKEAKQKADGSSGASPGGGGVPSLPGSAQEEWEYLKQSGGAQSDAVDKLMRMIGLEEVKCEFVGIKGTIDTNIRQNVSTTKQRYGCALLGNPGTGKTTVARLYAQFLTSVGVIPGSRFEETTGAKLAHGGVSGCQKMIDGVLNDGGGVVFIDEAYQLTSGNSPGGGSVLDFLLPEVENLTGKIVFVLAGYDKEMESFFAHNPGLPSRFPQEMKFADYTDAELLRILGLKIDQKYGGAMKCDGDGSGSGDGAYGGLFCRVVARRLGRGRGRPGFGNARAVENTLDKIARRQAARLTKERRAGRKPDDFLLTKEDLIGPEPAEALGRSKAWTKLSKLIGCGSVKQAVQALVDSVQQNYQRELAEQALIEYTLNKVFLGNPGTGKTTVAKLFGEILGDLGLLSKGEVAVRNPSDFVGSVLGESEKLTKGILAATVGKVLVIDEAYGLYGGGSGTTGGDIYKTAVIDTIVAEVQGVPGDDRCVLLLGYKEQLETMFQNVNPGLARRFPIASAFMFEDFSDDELRRILDLKLQQQSYKATDQAKRVALDMLNRARNRPNFGNGGEIDILLDAAKARHQVRLSKEGGGKAKDASLLEARDFDEDFDRAELRAETNVRKLFEGTVGAEATVAKLEGYQETVRTMKALDMDPKEAIPFNFVFRGPPGTGKTTTARKMGKVFYDMGFLATAEVIECSASDLVGQYVGQTGPKVVQQLDKALGRVLFVDEAYRLAEGAFAKEAVDELVDCATKERYRKKLVIILAGYEADMNRLLAANEGLTSRFPESVCFPSLGPDDCVLMLTSVLAAQKRKLEAKNKVTFDLGVLEAPAPGLLQSLRAAFAQLAGQASWANARDVETLGKTVFRETIKRKEDLAAKKLVVREETVLAALDGLLAERQNRESNVRSQRSPAEEQLLQQLMPSASREPPRTSTASAVSTKFEQTVQQDEPPPSKEEEEPVQPEKQETKIGGGGGGGGDNAAKRDAGVSDAVWEQLQRDRQAEQDRENEYQQLLKASQEAASEAARQKIVRRLVEEERRRKKEEATRAKLKQMGVCPMGYSWIKQRGGYRCAGGSHFMWNDQLGA